jgi:hypothetical protein
MKSIPKKTDARPLGATSVVLRVEREEGERDEG